MRASAASESRVATTSGRRALRAARTASRVSAFISAHLLDEDLHLAAAGEPDVPRLLVADTEGEQARPAVGDGRDALLDHGALEAAAGAGADHVAGLVDAELAADRPGRGAPGLDHGSDGDAASLRPPGGDLIEHVCGI